MSDTELSSPQAAVATSACSLCVTPLMAGAGTTINGSAVCDGCVAQVQAELAAEQQTGARFPVAVALGAAGGIVGAAVWAGIAIASGYSIGYVAVLVGYLAGLGVKYGAGKGRSEVLQFTAAGMALLGLVAAKYFIFAHAVSEYATSQGGSVSYFSPTVFAAFPSAIADMASPFDLLWLFLALSTAWRVPAPSKLQVGA